MTSPEPGTTFTFTGEQIGLRAETALKTGTLVTVREVVPADVKGAHSDAEDAVVITWEEEGQVIVNTAFETRSTPVMATASDGSVIMRDGEPVLKLQAQEVPVHEYGTGTVRRAMSVSLKQFATDFQTDIQEA